MQPLELHKKDYFPHQWDFLKETNKKVKGLVGGFGCGKTHVFLHETLINLITKKNKKGVSNGWVIYPTFDLADELFVEPFKEILENKGISYNYSISRRRFTTAYGNIKIYQLQKAARIVGAELTFIGFDEFDIESYKNCDIAYKKAVGRMRGADDGVIYIVTTPEGFGYTYKLFVTDMNENKLLVHGKTTDNPTLPAGYLNLMQSSYTDLLLKSYRDGQFCNISAESVYYNFKREEYPSGNIQKVKYNPNKPILIGQDWNVSPLSSVLLQEYDTSPKLRVFDIMQLHHSGGEILTERLITTLKAKYPKARFIMYPDAAGGARHTSSLYSDIQIARKAGIEIRVKGKNPPVISRVNAVNKILEKDLVVDPSLTGLIEDFEQVTHKPGTREIDKTSKHLTHLTDAIGYLIEFEYPVVRPKTNSIKRYN